METLISPFGRTQVALYLSFISIQWLHRPLGKSPQPQWPEHNDAFQVPKKDCGDP